MLFALGILLVLSVSHAGKITTKDAYDYYLRHLACEPHKDRCLRFSEHVGKNKAAELLDGFRTLVRHEFAFRCHFLGKDSINAKSAGLLRYRVSIKTGGRNRKKAEIEQEETCVEEILSDLKAGLSRSGPCYFTQIDVSNLLNISTEANPEGGYDIRGVLEVEGYWIGHHLFHDDKWIRCPK